MGMACMGVGHAGLGGAVGFGSGMEGPYPAYLVSADALRSSGHALWSQIRRIRKYAGQHSRYVLWSVCRAHMRELTGESSPLMHFPQKVRDLDQRIHLADFDVQVLGRRGNLAGAGCYDQGSG